MQYVAVAERTKGARARVVKFHDEWIVYTDQNYHKHSLRGSPKLWSVGGRKK